MQTISMFFGLIIRMFYKPELASELTQDFFEQGSGKSVTSRFGHKKAWPRCLRPFRVAVPRRKAPHRP